MEITYYRALTESFVDEKKQNAEIQMDHGGRSEKETEYPVTLKADVSSQRYVGILLRVYLCIYK